MSRGGVVVVLAIVAASSARLAIAQPAPAPEPPAPPPELPPSPTDEPTAAPPAPPAPATDPRSDAGWLLYHRSFEALAKGDRTAARAFVRQLGRERPDHPALALLHTEGLAELGGSVDEPAVAPGGAIVERPSRGARAELASFQAFHGLMLGLDLDLMAQPDSDTALVALPFLGTVAAIAGSLAYGDITPGQRALANSGTAWGEIETALLLGALPSSPSAEKIGAALAVGSVGGLATGAALSALHVTQGQVALANSGGLWTGAATLLAIAALDLSSSHSAEHFCEAVIASTSVGIVGGAYLAKRYPETTRSHTLVIDAGGLVGGVVGLAIGAIAANGIGNDQLDAGLALGGMLLGLGGATYVTRDWDAAPASSSSALANGSAYVVPVERGSGGIAGYAIQF